MDDDEQERYFESWLDLLYDKKIEDLSSERLAWYRSKFEQDLKENN